MKMLETPCDFFPFYHVRRLGLDLLVEFCTACYLQPNTIVSSPENTCDFINH